MSLQISLRVPATDISWFGCLFFRISQPCLSNTSQQNWALSLENHSLHSLVNAFVLTIEFCSGSKRKSSQLQPTSLRLLVEQSPNLLFGIPLLWSGVIIGGASIVILLFQGHRQNIFEAVIIGMLVVITAGFLAGLFFAPPQWSEVAGGLIPRFKGTDSILVAASMLGATVMPHAIYLHSSLVNDHHTDPEIERPHKRALLRATRHDILWALSIAGIVNIGLLLLAASALSGVEGTDTIEGAYHAIANALGGTVSTIFALGLLASGLASTSVGAYAGSEIMNGLLHVNVPLLARRLVTIIPALIILGMGAEPTWALVLSQVALSFGIPFAIVPLMYLTRNKKLMGEYVNKPLTIAVASVIAAAIILLNILLVYLTITGQS